MSVLQKNRKLAAGIGVAAVAAAALALGAGTYAAYTDSETVPQTTFAAGRMDLVVGGTATAGPMNFTDFDPGDSETKTLTLTNSGTVGGTLSVAFTVTGEEGICEEPEVDIEGTTCDSGSELVEQARVLVNGAPYGTLADLNSTGIPSAGPLSAGATATLNITVDLPRDANNAVMTDTAVITTTITLTQA